MSEPRGDAWWKGPDVSPWVKELVRVRSLGVARVGDTRSSELPLLKAKARQYYPNALLVRDQVRSLLQDVVGVLPEPYDEAAEYEFGLRPVPGQQQGSNGRRQAAAGRMGYSFSAFRHEDWLERHLLEKTAELLAEWDGGSSLSDPPQGFAGTYIFRPLLHEALDRAVAALRTPDAERWRRRNLIVIRGEPRSGASRLAFEYFRRNGTVRLPAEDEISLLTAACRLLEQHGHSAASEGATIRHQVGKLLGSTDGPRTVIFDNVSDVQSVLRWLPDRVRCLVVLVTSQAVDADLAPCVQVGALTDDEILDMLTDRLPALESAVAWRLGVAVGRRVGALEAVVRLLADLGDVEPLELIEAVESDIAGGLEAAESPSEVSLVAIHRRAVEVIRSQHAASWSLLAFIAFSSHRHLTERVLSAFAVGDIERSMTASGRVQFLAQIRPLLALGLVTKDRGVFAMDPLTARLVRSEAQDAVVETLITLVYTGKRPDETMVSPVDLADLGWTAADIASYMLVVATIQARIDPNIVLDSDFQGTGVRSHGFADVAISELAAEQWEKIFLLMRGMELGDNRSSMLTRFMRQMPRQTLGQFLASWRFSGTENAFPSFDQVASIFTAPRDDEELDGWLAELDLPRPVGERRRAQWHEAYRTYKFALLSMNSMDEAAENEFSKLQAFWPQELLTQMENLPFSERTLAEFCFDLTRRFDLTKRYMRRGERMEGQNR